MSLEFDGPSETKPLNETNSTKSIDKSDKDHIQIISDNISEGEMCPACCNLKQNMVYKCDNDIQNEFCVEIRSHFSQIDNETHLLQINNEGHSALESYKKPNIAYTCDNNMHILQIVL